MPDFGIPIYKVRIYNDDISTRVILSSCLPQALLDKSQDKIIKFLHDFYDLLGRDYSLVLRHFQAENPGLRVEVLPVIVEVLL